jgi:neutral ceramidase
MLIKYLPIILAVLSGHSLHAQQTAVAVARSSAGFHAAAVKVNITPQNPQWLRGYSPRQSTGILDSLYHRIVAFDDGKTQFFLVSSDLLGIPPAEYQRVTALLQRRYGINPLNV